MLGDLNDGRPLIARFLTGALCLALAAIVALAVACGGGSEESTTPVVQEPTPTIVPFPGIDTNVPLVEYHSTGRGYSIGYPQGWEPDASPDATGAGTDFFLWEIGGTRFAVLQVTCNQQALSIDALMMTDAAFASRYGGILDPNTAVPVEVGGVEGRRLTYNLSIGGLTVEHVVAYIAHGECGWRIGLSTFDPETREQLLPLFERILASFKLG